MREALTEAGCPVADKFFKPERCSIQAGGGFKQDEGDSRVDFHAEDLHMHVLPDLSWH